MIRWFTEDQLASIDQSVYSSKLIGIGNKCKHRIKRQLIEHKILVKQNKSWILSNEYKRMFDSWLSAECVVDFKNVNNDQIIVLLTLENLLKVSLKVFISED